MKHQIEDVIQKGYLKEYIKKEKRKRSLETHEIQGKKLPQLNMIFGGPSLGGSSNRARKAYARKAVQPVTELGIFSV